MRLLFTLLALLSFGSAAHAQITVLAFESNGTSPNMYFMQSDQLGVLRKSVTLSDPSNTYTIGRILGAAYYYPDNEIYVLAATGSASAKNNRVIFTVDTTSGEVTEVVDPQDDLWQAMAILEDGTILLSAGKQTGLSRGIYSIDRSTGDATFLTDVPGADVNGIAFNADDDLVYYTHSQQDITTDSTFLAYDPADWSATDIGMSPAASFTGGGLTYLGNDSMLVTNLSGGLAIYPTAGGAADLSSGLSSQVGKVKALAGIYNPDGIVGRASAAQTLSVTVFPNPAENVLHIGVGTDNQLQHVQVRDLSGRTLIDQPAVGRALDVEVDRLSAGLYVLDVQTANGRHTQRVVVR